MPITESRSVTQLVARNVIAGTVAGRTQNATPCAPAEYRRSDETLHASADVTCLGCLCILYQQNVMSYCRLPAQPECLLALHIAYQHLQHGIQMTTCRVMIQMTMMMLPTFNCSHTELLLTASHPT